MRYVKKRLSIIVFVLFSFTASAVDVPEYDIGGQEMDQSECVTENANNCVDDQCLNSENIDCQENCKKMAEDKCQEQSDD